MTAKARGKCLGNPRERAFEANREAAERFAANVALNRSVASRAH
jgi:hypothetical protein